jgi:iron complex outermembrane recepter protein
VQLILLNKSQFIQPMALMPLNRVPKSLVQKYLKILLMLIGIVSIMIPLPLIAQLKLSGTVISDQNQPISGAHIYLHETKQIALSNNLGQFIFNDLRPGVYRLHVSYLGYKCIHPYKATLTDADEHVIVLMEPESLGLNEVVINGFPTEAELRERPEAIVVVSNRFMDRQRDHSLLKTLESLPGIQAMEIGQGASKPVIRGLGLNRVVVTENNTRLEGQQWGADHGLEIDQFAVEMVEVVKGPSSLRFGSDALGGVIRIKPQAIAQPNSLSAQLTLVGRSVNDLLAGSLMMRLRKNNYFNYIRYTHSDYGTYRVPADNYTYNSYKFQLKNGRIQNSGGEERNIYITNGILQPWGKFAVTVSNVYAKSGYFPGAHGIPNSSMLEKFPISRKVDLPYQQVNHFKISTNTLIKINSLILEMDLAFQQNNRQEWSRFHTHYPGQEAPLNNPDLELDWLLQTISADLRAQQHRAMSTTEVGLSVYRQQHEIGGYMFLLPEYSRSMAGAFIYHQFDLARNIKLSGGLRYDLGQLQIDSYFSPYTNITKAPDFDRLYHDLSWALGMVINMNRHAGFKTNIAKSFRMPTASEIGSNGIHHGTFRYELGDQGLQSEVAYQFDAGFSYENSKMQLGFGPFFSYFPNFIYLNPSGSYLLPDGSPVMEAGAGQVYSYVQSQAFRAGGEMTIGYQFNHEFQANLSGEYVFATDGTYPIPLTPPLSFLFQLEYHLPEYWKRLHQPMIAFETRYAGAQNRHARNEEPTAAWFLVNLNVSAKFITGNSPISFSLRMQNLLNTKYWNHLSYYRKIGLPEAGRNVQLSVQIPIQTKLKSNK